MANNVTVIVLGGQPKTMSADTVQELIDSLDLDSPSIKINGNTASASDTLEDFAHVAFGEKVKGGR